VRRKVLGGVRKRCKWESMCEDAGLGKRDGGASVRAACVAFWEGGGGGGGGVRARGSGEVSFRYGPRK